MSSLDKPDIDEVRFEYRDRTGQVATRRVMPLEIWFGTNAFYKTPQWLLKAFDLDKEADHDFALKDVREWRPA